MTTISAYQMFVNLLLQNIPSTNLIIRHESDRNIEKHQLLESQSLISTSLNDRKTRWFLDSIDSRDQDEFRNGMGSMANDHLHVLKRLGDEMLPSPKRARNSVSIESFIQDPADQIFDNI